MKKRVEIRVDQLVLHGLPPEQRRAVGKAVEQELARLAARGELTADRQPTIPPILLPRGGRPS